MESIEAELEHALTGTHDARTPLSAMLNPYVTQVDASSAGIQGWADATGVADSPHARDLIERCLTVPLPQADGLWAVGQIPLCDESDREKEMPSHTTAEDVRRREAAEQATRRKLEELEKKNRTGAGLSASEKCFLSFMSNQDWKADVVITASRKATSEPSKSAQREAAQGKENGRARK